MIGQEKPFNLDLNQGSRFNSNFWVLGVFISLIVSGMILYFGLKDGTAEAMRANANAMREIIQVQKDMISYQTAHLEQYQRQEKHFEFADARIDTLEKKATSVEKTVDIIANAVGWMRGRSERMDRDKKSSE